jgi:predicted hydrocarbon binding protein
MATTGPSPQQVEFLKKLSNGLLVEFTISSLSELLKYSDHAQTYDLAKKIMIEATLSAPWLHMESIANKKGIEAALGPLYVAQTALVSPNNIEVEMREKGAVGTIHECPFKNAFPEICLFMSHVGADVFCQLADPEVECLWTHHMTAGDPFCRYVIKKKSVIYKDPDSLGKVILKLPRVEFTDEQLVQFRNMLLAGYWAGNTISFKTFNGPEKTIEVLGKNAMRIGKNFGSSLIEANMLPSRDISVMGGFINMFGEGSGMQGKITSMAPGVFTKEITECPFKGGPLGSGIPEICKQFEAFYNGMLEKLNPELEFHYDRMMTTGDKTCKWVITKK